MIDLLSMCQTPEESLEQAALECLQKAEETIQGLIKVNNTRNSYRYTLKHNEFKPHKISDIAEVLTGNPAKFRTQLNVRYTPAQYTPGGPGCREYVEPAALMFELKVR